MGGCLLPSGRVMLGSLGAALLVALMEAPEVGRWYLLAALLTLLASCDDGPREPTETDVFNVYSYYPKRGSEELRGEYLGQVTGISACQRAAPNFAGSKNMNRSDGWSYICCLQTKTSSCAEKHK
jgi:hypothetical protein